MKAIVFYSDHRHASTILVAIFREEGARIQIYLCVFGVIPTHYKYICILSLTTLKMATRVIEACRWSL
jgi:hypothetical protein